MAEKSKSNKIIAQNKKAWHDYFVDEKYEAGIALYGTRREIYLTEIPCVIKSFSCTKKR